MTTTSDAVQNIANFMAEAEKRAHLNVKGSRDMRDEFKAISDDGIVPVLKVSKFHAELVALTTGYAAALLDLHDRMTDTAKLYNVDVPPAQETQGDDVGILSGGGR
jgi:hypothetical protein